MIDHTERPCFCAHIQWDPTWASRVSFLLSTEKNLSPTCPAFSCASGLAPLCTQAQMELEESTGQVFLQHALYSVPLSVVSYSRRHTQVRLKFSSSKPWLCMVEVPQPHSDKNSQSHAPDPFWRIEFDHVGLLEHWCPTLTEVER